ncbi:IQ and AAA domain-containing protein 1-like [Cydia pomonella]|uniref:IQ and AAA domain-containing protein 1-like n=1 Tax=Cydia pomonella TaxID=82600 RepID=UPI002ADD9971|nr:IQ and AAA domain-containing protein 1-like [Cydia pomonella]
MANKDYYERWLQIKKDFNVALIEDARLQEFANNFLGIKPQATAVELVARVYCKYCALYNKLCDSYDQMEQVQRRPCIKAIIDALTCRILELKWTLQEVEAFEYTYPENALQQLLLVPQDIQIITPYFYPFEVRQQEMQYIIDEIFAGNRLGDPEPTPSEAERLEEERQAEEERIREEKEAEIHRKLAMGEDISESEGSEQLSPEEIAEREFLRVYNGHLWNIQRMERARTITREKIKKYNKDTDLYLELAGLKKPAARESLRIKASGLIQQVYRRFMLLKREKTKENERRRLLGMIIPSWLPPSAKPELEKVRNVRREFRKKYFQEWMEANVKEKTHVLRLRKDDIMEDISAEVRQWFSEWYYAVRVFDEYPWPDEGGSILVVRGETFTIPEFIEWREAEIKRKKAESGNPKTPEQIKAEKAEAKAEKKRLELEAKEKEIKRLENYRKSRLNPDNDPGVYISIGKNFYGLQEAWNIYQNQWKDIDTPDAPLDVMRGFVKEFITETAYQDVNLQLRPIVDEMMRVELQLLKASLKIDYEDAGVTEIPQSKKRKKPRKKGAQKRNKITPAMMFQTLVDEGIIRKYPRTTLDDYWGDLNYAAADMRAVLWTPSFPPPCLGDVREQVRVLCLLTSGCSCPDAVRSQLLVGPKGSGKRTLVYAIATETNSILIDLSPTNVYDKFPGPALKTMFKYINEISRIMQPTVILVDNADKVFYKAVPKEDKWFDPQRLSKDFFKEIVKPLTPSDKIMVLGTASEPWLAKPALLSKAFPSLILIPRSDYGSICLVLMKVLMKYHGISRSFNVHSAAQTLRGYDVNSIKRALDKLLSADRIAQLYFKPLRPEEIIDAVLMDRQANYVDPFDYEMFQEWYLSYSPWGTKYIYLKEMLESQLVYKLKADKKKNK